MKTKALCLLLVSFIVSTSTHAQETSVMKFQSPSNLPFLTADRLAIFLAAYPFPILSEGIGVAAEYALIDHVGIWAEASRAVTSASGDSFYQISGGTKVTDTSQMLGLRGYLSESGLSGFYFGAGAKSVNIDVSAQPGLLAGPRVNKQEQKIGAFGAIGYRYRSGDSGRFVLLIDLGLHYGPGKVNDVKYVTDTLGIFGAQTAHVEAEATDGFFPEARIGLRF